MREDSRVPLSKGCREVCPSLHHLSPRGRGGTRSDAVSVERSGDLLLGFLQHHNPQQDHCSGPREISQEGEGAHHPRREPWQQRAEARLHTRHDHRRKLYPRVRSTSRQCLSVPGEQEGQPSAHHPPRARDQNSHPQGVHGHVPFSHTSTSPASASSSSSTTCCGTARKT